MKKIIILSVTLIISFTCFSQVEVGAFGGPHTTITKYSISHFDQSTENKYGFHAGIACKIPFEVQLDFVPTISYKLMGYKVSFNRPSYPPDLLAQNNDTRFHQVDVDILLQYNFSQKPGHFILRLGPSFNFILFGHEKFDLATGEYVSRNMKFSTTNGYGRYEASVTGQFGYETKSGLTFYVDYMHGLMSMNNEERGPSIYNRVAGITIGKFFRSKKIVVDTRNKE